MIDSTIIEMDRDDEFNLYYDQKKATKSIRDQLMQSHSPRKSQMDLNASRGQTKSAFKADKIKITVPQTMKNHSPSVRDLHQELVVQSSPTPDKRNVQQGDEFQFTSSTGGKSAKADAGRALAEKLELFCDTFLSMDKKNSQQYLPSNDKD